MPYCGQNLPMHVHSNTCTETAEYSTYIHTMAQGCTCMASIMDTSYQLHIYTGRCIMLHAYFCIVLDAARGTII